MGRSDRVIAFVENLTNTAGPAAGKPFRLREWQKDIIRRIYDPVAEDGRRKIRTALLTLPRKNGKTELSAALALAHLLGPEAEINGQIYIAAADRNQASILFNVAAAMVRADAELAAMVNIIESTKRIVHYKTGSFLQAISSDAKSKHGFNASAILYDELAQAPNRTLFDVLTTSTAARAEPLTLVLSTQSSDPLSVMTELTDYARKLQDGTLIDETFTAIIYEAPMDADPWAEETWFLANPGLGDFRSLEEMRASALQAQRIPERESAFRNLYLNQAVAPDLRFIAAADWLANGDPVDLDRLTGRKCWGGLDLSSTTDLTALVLVFPDDGDPAVLDVLAWFWTAGDTLDERANRDRAPYRLWERQGHLEATQGRAIDKRAVVRRLGAIAGQFDLQSLAFDRWRFDEVKRLLDEEGLSLPLAEFGQGFASMAPAVDALESMILNRRLRHGNHPVLTWNMSNAAVTSDPAGNRKLDKSKATQRIDGAVALAMAVGAYSSAPVEDAISWGALVL